MSAGPEVGRLLQYLGVEAERPSPEFLTRVHRAFVSGVTYGTVDIQLGNPPTLDPEAAAHRVLDGRVGYCFGMNGAFAWLLGQLGFDLELRSAVVRRPSDIDDPGVNHVTLVVHLPEGDMLADAGMGDGMLEPIPLVEGEYLQEPHRFALRRESGRWTFLHDPAGSFSAMDVGTEAIEMADLAKPHAHLSTSPDSSFVRALVLLRRRESSIDTLRSRTLYRLTADGRTKRVLADADEFREVVERLFAVTATDDELEALWQRADGQHQAFLASRR